MEHIYLIATIVGLAVSWFYILLLKAEIHDYVRYIQARVRKMILGSIRPRGDHSTLYPSIDLGNAASAMGGEDCSPGFENESLHGIPQLIIGNLQAERPFHYLCSHCLQPFSLPRNRPAKDAAEKLLSSFRKHIEQHHPSALARSATIAEG
jgi:hypothetical protein